MSYSRAKAVYIAGLVWDKQDVEARLDYYRKYEKIDASTSRVMVSDLTKELEEINQEIKRIDNDETYTPWKNQ